MGMKDDILDQLYFGKIIPWEKHHGSNPEMVALNQRIDEAIHSLEAKLDDEGKAILARLTGDFEDLETRSICEGFKDGYRLGTRLTAAAFCSEEKP